MKICMLTRTYPPRLGGPGSLVYRLSKILAEKGFEITVITHAVKGYPKYEEQNGVKIYRTFCSQNEFSTANLIVSTLAFTNKIIKEFKKYDLFHAHDISVAGFAGCLAKNFTKKPFFLKYGGTLVFEYLSLKKPKGWDPRQGLEGTLKYHDLKAGVLRNIEKWYFRNYNMILPDSEYGKEFLMRAFKINENKIHVLPNGVEMKNISKIENIFNKKYGLYGKIIFTAARITNWKGIDILIEAMKNVVVRVPDAKLVIAGEGPKLEEYISFAKKLGLEKNVFFIGKVHPDDMYLYLNSCDIFALASYFDTSPNVLLEAMSCSKPSVVSDIDGIREVVLDKYALKARVADPKSFAEQIIKLCSNKAMANKIGKLARKRIEEKYDINITAKNYINLYDKWFYK